MADKTADKTDELSTAELEKQLAALRDDFSNLGKLLKDMTEDRVGRSASHAYASAEDLTREAKARGYEARDAIERAVKDHPVTSLGIAAVLGFVLGALSRR